MRLTKLAFVLIALLGLCLPVAGQSRRIMSGSASFTSNKFGFYFETYLDPSIPELANVYGGVSPDDTRGVIHRFMVDSGRRVYFGYDVSVETLPEASTYRLTFTQLTLTPRFLQGVLRENPVTWTQISTPGWEFSSPRTFRAGEVVALNLLTNPGTGQKIVDYVTVQEPARAPLTFANVTTPPREFAFATGSPRDFRAEDAELRLRDPRLSINGRPDPSTTALDMETSGPIVWFYVPNRGRFFISLTPLPDLGFRKAGEVRGGTLSFSAGSDTFTLIAGAPIAPRQTPFNLYVLHDPAWKPSYPFADLSRFALGTADRADLVGK